jgi:hypothetical protein
MKKWLWWVLGGVGLVIAWLWWRARNNRAAQVNALGDTPYASPMANTGSVSSALPAIYQGLRQLGANPEELASGTGLDTVLSSFGFQTSSGNGLLSGLGLGGGGNGSNFDSGSSSTSLSRGSGYTSPENASSGEETTNSDTLSSLFATNEGGAPPSEVNADDLAALIPSTSDVFYNDNYSQAASYSEAPSGGGSPSGGSSPDIDQYGGTYDDGEGGDYSGDSGGDD